MVMVLHCNEKSYNSTCKDERVVDKTSNAWLCQLPCGEYNNKIVLTFNV